ncbi:hypothetical protein CCMSSC00406_0007338 [Pleurotus cornucopiae]|uniref:Uncharacterized protein n=1 Tax=Pleurotus cornucopiae TaxID=5321 RepID=A0ACB7ITX0_PLECO|nr:hypothetical protein CCMSSC00406_0007338 [Pleurotus cornucopiae]
MLQAFGVHIESIVLSVFGRWIAPMTPEPTLTTPTTTTRNEVDGAQKPSTTPPPPPPSLSPRLKIPKILKFLGRILGYIWVWHWFAHTAPVLFDPLIKAGFVDDLRGVLSRGHDPADLTAHIRPAFTNSFYPILTNSFYRRRQSEAPPPRSWFPHNATASLRPLVHLLIHLLHPLAIHLYTPSAPASTPPLRLR